MTRNLTMASRLREVLLNGHWIANTNYKEQILSLNWRHATQKIDTLNTIAALTYHINYYLAGLLNAFENGKLEIRDKYSFDMPKISSEADWNKLVADFLDNSEKFVLTTSGGTTLEVFLTDPKLIEKMGGGKIPTTEAEKTISVVRKMLREKKSNT